MTMPKGWKTSEQQKPSRQNKSNENDILCKNCEKKSRAGSLFCNYCGIKFEKDIQNSSSSTIDSSISRTSTSESTHAKPDDSIFGAEAKPDFSYLDNILNSDDPKTRLESYDKYLETHRTSPIAMKGKAGALAEMGRYEEAIDTCNLALKTSPYDYSLWLNKAKALIALNRDDEAIQCYAKVLEFSEKEMSLRPDNLDALMAKAVALMDLQRYDNAVECYDRALALSPSDDYIWNNKGYALSELKDFDNALICFDEVIKLNPKNVDAWRNKAHVFESLEKPDKEIECYSKILELDPNNFNAWSDKGLVLLETGVYEEALQCYNRAIEISPNDSEVWNSKGLALLWTENYTQAISCFDKALELNPGYVDAMYYIGSTRIKIGLLDEGFLDMEKAIKLGGKEIQDTLKQDEFMKEVKDDPRFKRLLGN